jgi:hypothetical protein
MACSRFLPWSSTTVRRPCGRPLERALSSQAAAGASRPGPERLGLVAARGLIDVIDVIDHAWRHGDRTAASIAAAWLQLRLLHGWGPA